MDIKSVLIEAIREKKNNITIRQKLSNIMIDTFLRISARDSGVPNVTYKYVRLDEDTIQVEFIYDGKPAPSVTVIGKELPKKKESPFHKLTPEEKMIANKLYKEIALDDLGDESFIEKIDLLEARIFNIYTSSWERTVKTIDKYAAYLTAKAEGAIALSYNTYESNADGTFKVRLEFVLGTDYKTFLTNLYEGHKKAKEIYEQITGGVSLPPEVICLHASAYLQKNCTYNHEYCDELIGEDVDVFKEGQKIENAMAYGSLVLKKAICEGYAWGFIRILEAGGYEACIGSGEKDGVAHEWAKVKIDGEWYNIEVTISNPHPFIVITSFLVSDEMMKSQGYKLRDFNVPCTSHRFEGENLNTFFSNYSLALEKYVEQGLSKDYYDIEYAFVDLD